ncbi:hypothetical protein [Xanthocytophaga flava]|uniref:hypothetical protein n=1 Tax=Xanthocytophaga flava TaxID=3048013 RepID=UPI0028D01669|nr:hypothetical protein [Xanthocytophaga flavus]MDJ1467770.1 hypothetical protein [Xanthocytophaga flavus]
MSLNITVYCKQVSPDLIPQIMRRLNEYDMIVEVYPAFKFDQQKDIGFLPFKFRLKNPNWDILKDKELKSGFELYISNFDLNEEKANLKSKRSLFDKLRGKKQVDVAFAPPNIESRLQECKKAVSFVWHVLDSFELRFASMASAILAELTDGVCSYPADNIWYDNKDIVDQAFKEVIAYENSLLEKEIKFHEFNSW